MLFFRLENIQIFWILNFKPNMLNGNASFVASPEVLESSVVSAECFVFKAGNEVDVREQAGVNFIKKWFVRKSVFLFFHKCYKAIIIGKKAFLLSFPNFKCCKNTYFLIVIISSIFFSFIYFITILCFAKIKTKCP